MSRMRDLFFETADALTAANAQDELCCVFAREWTRRAYGTKVVDQAPASAWNLHKGTSQWGPAEACVTCGINVGPAIVCTPDTFPALKPKTFYRLQGWRPDATGHTFTLEILPEGRARVYDSAKDRNERIANVNLKSYLAQYGTGLCVVELKPLE